MALSFGRSFVFGLVSIALGLLLALLICEVILRLLGIGYGNAPLVSDPVLHHVHPVNYRFVSHTPSNEYGGHEIYYDGQGLVTDPEIDIPIADSAINRVAFLGDSFTEAGQVAYSKSFVGRVGNASKGISWVKNFGVSSYSPILYLLLWREKVSQFQPTHVIVMLYGNDISDDAVRFKQAKLSESGEILALPGPGGGRLIQWLRKLYLARLVRKLQLQLQWTLENPSESKSVVGGMVEENPEITPLSSSLLEQLANDVKNAGAELILMVVPSKYRLSLNDKSDYGIQFSERWQEWAAQRGIRFIDLVSAFDLAASEGQRLFYEHDIHFNENGHAVVAETLIKELPFVFGGEVE